MFCVILLCLMLFLIPVDISVYQSIAYYCVCVNGSRIPDILREITVFTFTNDCNKQDEQNCEPQTANNKKKSNSITVYK